MRSAGPRDYERRTPRSRPWAVRCSGRAAWETEGSGSEARGVITFDLGGWQTRP